MNMFQCRVTEDLIQDRTSFEQMVLYANEMMYKIENREKFGIKCNRLIFKVER